MDGLILTVVILAVLAFVAGFVSCAIVVYKIFRA